METNKQKTNGPASAPAAGTVTVAGAVRPPEGLARVGSVANAPWFNLAAGNVCHGMLENMYLRPDERAKASGGKSKFFQIRLLSDAQVRFGRGKEAKVGMAKAGDVVNLNYGPKTMVFETYVPDILRGAEYEVWCHVTGEKFDIGKGQTMWPIDVRAGMKKAPTVVAADSEPDFGDDDEDGAPGATA